ncbi:hypothetical protein H4R18_005641 [Coemansia javaensis]|uniref:Uncharacterized protein n=1 Tax=Coemansia javaensis TaxID=2761396 RepID=A0A9W8H187_9FUNG|nr:hypothetical protein H4R18_005641 [Coemansia javaensis]
MDDSYTIFRRRPLTWDVQVFRGDLDEKPQKGQQAADYELRETCRAVVLSRGGGSGREEVLTGRYAGIARRKATVEGQGELVATARRSGRLTAGWQFTHMDKTYTWHVRCFCSDWKLKDGSGAVVARLERSRLRYWRNGVLRMASGADAGLRELALLTCQIVRRTARVRASGKSAFSRDVLVFEGEVEEQPAASAAAYEIEMGWRAVALRRRARPGGQLQDVLGGVYEGVLGRSAVLRGEALVSTPRRIGVLVSGWSFTYGAEEFHWDVSTLNRSWVLTDGAGRAVARFRRASLKYTKIGVLHIESEPGPDLAALAILTCEMVHRTLKNERK